MFRKQLYLVCLLLSILFWSAATWRSQTIQRQLQPEQLAKTISKDITRQQQAFRDLLAQHPDALRRALAGTPGREDVAILSNTPFYLYLYQQDSLHFWNTIRCIPDNPPDHYPFDGTLIEQGGSTYYAQRFRPAGMVNTVQDMLVFLPIKVIYPFENDYLQSHFVAAANIPATSEVSTVPDSGSVAIKDIRQRTIGYLLLDPDDLPVYEADCWIILTTLLSLLSLLASIQLIILRLWRNNQLTLATLLAVAPVLLIELVLYVWCLPFGISDTHIFSPLLYASSTFLPSLGHVLVNLLLLLWLAVFIIQRLSYKKWLQGRIRMPLRIVMGIVLAIALVAGILGLAHVAASIVLDSSISFDIAHLYTANKDTITGLLTITLLCVMALVYIYLVNLLLRNAFQNKWWKLAAIFLAGLVFFLLKIPGAYPEFYLALFLWLLLVSVLLDIHRLSFSTEPFSNATLFWMVFMSLSGTGLLAYFNYNHELEARKKYAEQLVTRHDDAMEWNFKSIAENIQKDALLQHYLQQPDGAQRSKVNEHLNHLYFNTQLNNYQPQLYLFNASGQPLYNEDTLQIDVLKEMEAQAIPTATAGLYYTEDVTDGHYYLADIPMADSNSKALGTLYIDLTLKKTENETVFPELIQPARINKAQKEAGYYYAVYVNKHLLTQSNDYPFPFYLHNAPQSQQEFEWHRYAEFSTLTYRAPGGREVIVARGAYNYQEVFTLFSYLFGIQLCAAFSFFLYRLLLEAITHKSRTYAINLTLRKRIQLSMLAIVLVSFFIIAITTIAFFRQRYAYNNRKNIHTVTQHIAHALQQYVKEEVSKNSTQSFPQLVTGTAFRYFITDLARSQKTDINLFDAHGKLLAASQNDIYDKGLLGKVIPWEVLQQLLQQPQLLLIQQEHIGKLNYSSGYIPLSNENGEIQGYINIPFFSAQKELDAQIADILVALINLYALIFLVSSLLAVLATSWLTRALNIIIRQFGRLNLQKNELLSWPYEDEIGLLVHEYNKMVQKVESNALLLVKSEREGAWREMARQVAHEIKNPLTPMKLNIQYLQQALRQDHPDVKTLAARVSASMLEQIENLSYIASEFSDFANIPEARPELIVLNELLDTAVSLYQQASDIDVVLVIPNEELLVFADHSQLLRVLTNLLQNAVQAIPTEDRKGMIEITLTKMDTMLRLAIRDNGRGIAPAVADRIFHPYFTTKSSGTGLGLAMTKKIIELSKGTIWFKSIAGEGTTFFIELPLADK